MLPTRTDLEAEHTKEAVKRRLDDAGRPNYLGDAVLGAVDGAVTTFAIVAGVVGGSLPGGVAILLGIANLIADGFSMGASNYEAAISQRGLVERARRAERRQIELIPEGEREEIRQIFARKGFEDPMLSEVVDVIVADRDLWVDTMLREELGLQIDTPTPWKAGGVTFLAFCIVGAIPLLPFALAQTVDGAFLASCIATALTFIAIGAARGAVLEQPIVRSALSTLLTGGTAAAIAYGLGHGLKSFVEI